MNDCICGTQPELEDNQGRNPYCRAGLDPEEMADLLGVIEPPTGGGVGGGDLGDR